MCDAGVHPAFSGMAALPFLDELDWSTVDAILITHFHLDHAASLTYVMEKVCSLELPSSQPGVADADVLFLPQTNFKEGNGVVYMSNPTKAVYRYLMSDFVRVSYVSGGVLPLSRLVMLATSPLTMCPASFPSARPERTRTSSPRTR